MSKRESDQITPELRFQAIRVNVFVAGEHAFFF